MTVETVIAQQVALYGEPLSVRFARLLAAYGIPQSRLAATIGLSAPMLSQLASGQRVKISNPSVYARLLRLEQLAASAGVRTGERAHLEAVLEDVSASRPQLTTEHAVASAPGAQVGVATDADAALAQLARVSQPAELTAAAAAVPGTPLGDLLIAAATYRAG